MKKVLSIAGSDCSGGAGIQADIKTICAHNMYAMTAITALTAQNTTGVYDIVEVSPEFLAKQLDCIFQDIYPDAVKIGMVPNSEIVCVISEKLREYQVKNIVVDTVMVSTSGSRLMQQEACKVMKEQLFPLGKVLTPNLFEAEVLSGIEIKSQEDMVLAAAEIGKYTQGAVLVREQMIFSMKMRKKSGIAKKKLKIPIHMVQAVLCLLPLHVTLPKGILYRKV